MSAEGNFIGTAFRLMDLVCSGLLANGSAGFFQTRSLQPETINYMDTKIYDAGRFISLKIEIYRFSARVYWGREIIQFGNCFCGCKIKCIACQNECLITPCF